jgi:autotransporter-associated beta strand protein
VIDNTAGTAATLTIGANDGTGTFGGVIRNTSGTVSLVKTGGGSITLSGSNSFTGSTSVNAGTLSLGVNNALPVTSAVSLAGSTLTVGGYTNTIGSLSTSGNSTINVSINGGSTGSLSMGSLSFGSGTNTLALSMTSATAGIYNVLSYSGNKTGSFTATGVDSKYTVLQGATSNGVIAVQRKADLGTVSASVTNATIITGGSTAITYTVTNTTPTGGATLSFASENDSNVSGVSSGSALANSTSGSISGLFFTGTGIGSSQAGSFTVQDLAAITTTGTGNVSLTVLDHATPAFVGQSPLLTNLVLDFGSVDESAGLQSLGYSLTNLVSTYGTSLTAGLALTGFTHDSGDTLFSTGLSTFANLVAGTTSQYTASFTPGTQGTFSETFKLSFSDNQSIPGAVQRRDLTLTMNVVVVPEPEAIALAGIGIAAAAYTISRRRR